MRLRSLLRIVLAVAAVNAAALLLFGCASFQRKLIYFPTHTADDHGLAPWTHQGQTIGYAREVPAPRVIWLLLHGNGGQASDRVFALPNFPATDSVFILEYPGYGLRPGTPSLPAFNAAARQAYDLLRARFPENPVCVVGDSLGTGPACVLTAAPRPPDKLILVVPHDTLANVAARHYPFLPVRLLLRDRWDNVAALAPYAGPLEIFAATHDTVIPVAHARALAATKPQAIFHEFPAGHNDWPRNPLVPFRYP